jgi:hypothetical protein
MYGDAVWRCCIVAAMLNGDVIVIPCRWVMVGGIAGYLLSDAERRGVTSCPDGGESLTEGSVGCCSDL